MKKGVLMHKSRRFLKSDSHGQKIFAYKCINKRHRNSVRCTNQFLLKTELMKDFVLTGNAKFDCPYEVLSQIVLFFIQSQGKFIYEYNFNTTFRPQKIFVLTEYNILWSCPNSFPTLTFQLRDNDAFDPCNFGTY